MDPKLRFCLSFASFSSGCSDYNKDLAPKWTPNFVSGYLLLRTKIGNIMYATSRDRT